jgi:hypothetical protein
MSLKNSSTTDPIRKETVEEEAGESQMKFVMQLRIQMVDSVRMLFRD